MKAKTPVTKNPATRAKSSAPVVAKRKMATWKRVLAAVVVVIVAVVAIALVATSGPAKISDQFVDNLLKNNSSLAYDSFSSDAQKVTDRTAFAGTVQRMSDVLDNTAKQKSKEVNAETGKAATAVVVYEIKGSDGTYTLTVNLIKDNGKWKVLNFENNLNR